MTNKLELIQNELNKYRGKKGNYLNNEASDFLMIGKLGDIEK